MIKTLSHPLRASLSAVADYYDRRKVGDVGHLGFRRSTDLSRLMAGVDRLVAEGVILPGKTRFLDLGCADGRVNVFLSYLVGISVGIELDEWTLDEYAPLKSQLTAHLKDRGLSPPPDNLFLFQGDSTDKKIHARMASETGLSLQDFDLFYTYLVMHEEFARLIRDRARPGAVFMVYGLEKVLPRYPGFQLLDHLSPLEGILAFYRKI